MIEPAPYEFRCNACFVWQNSLETMDPGVRIIPNSVVKIKRNHYAHMSASEFKVKHDIVIGIPTEDNTYDVLAHKGALYRLTPSELVIPVVMRVAALLADKNTTDSDVRHIKTALRSCTFVFKAVSASDMKYWAMQFREDLRSYADAVDWTALQRIQCVMAERDTLVKASEAAKNILSE